MENRREQNKSMGWSSKPLMILNLELQIPIWIEIVASKILVTKA